MVDKTRDDLAVPLSLRKQWEWRRVLSKKNRHHIITHFEGCVDAKAELRLSESYSLGFMSGYLAVICLLCQNRIIGIFVPSISAYRHMESGHG